MSALTTLSAFKSHLGVTGTAQDVRLQQLLDGAEAAVLTYTGRLSLAQVSVTEYYSGNDRERICLKRRPIVSVASVNLDGNGYGGQASGAFAADTLLEAGVDYMVDNLEVNESNKGMLVRLGRCAKWDRGVGNVKVTYTAGYSTIPADLALAVHQVGALARKGAANGGGMAAETLGSYSYSLLRDDSSLVDARSLLARYVEVSL